MKKAIFLALLSSLALAACGPKVLKQMVPVSSNPAGATASADGRKSCVTPCTLELERNMDHIVTVTLPGYGQQDVQVTRQFQRERAMSKVFGAGIEGARAGNPMGGINAGMEALEEQEQTGEAYILTPSTVQVTLEPAR